MAPDDPKTKVAPWDVEDAGRRGGLAVPDWLPALSLRGRRALSEWALSEVAPGRLLPWLPVAFGSGIALYFAADREPAWWAASGLALATIAIAVHGAAAALRLSAGAGRCGMSPPAFASRPCRPRASRIPSCKDRPGARRSRALSKPARSANAATALSCGSAASKRRASLKNRNACGWRCVKGPRRRSASLSRSKRICRRRCSRYGRAATTSRATCISNGSAAPAMCSARSRPSRRHRRKVYGCVMRHSSTDCAKALTTAFTAYCRATAVRLPRR